MRETHSGGQMDRNFKSPSAGVAETVNKKAVTEATPLSIMAALVSQGL